MEQNKNVVGELELLKNKIEKFRKDMQNFFISTISIFIGMNISPKSFEFAGLNIDINNSVKILLSVLLYILFNLYLERILKTIFEKFHLKAIKDGIPKTPAKILANVINEKLQINDDKYKLDNIIQNITENLILTAVILYLIVLVLMNFTGYVKNM